MTPHQRARAAVTTAKREGYIVPVDTVERAYELLRDDPDTWGEVPRVVLELDGRL